MDLGSPGGRHGQPVALVLDPPDIRGWDREPSRSPLADPPPPRLSPLRVLALALVVALALGGAAYAVLGRSGTEPALAAQPTTYAPYVDVTLTPTYAFEDPTANPVGDVVLGFVVAQHATDSCTPTWGGAYTLDAANSAMDLDRRIEQMHRQGGRATVSFGGQANTELAVSCTDPGRLAQAYDAVLKRYDVDSIDLDIEGGALADRAANTRRAQAIARLQRTKRLEVWLTLPVATEGFTADGLAAIEAMLDAGVDLAGVNAMAMDFAPTAATKRDMLGAVTRSLNAAHGQFATLTRQAGLDLTDAQLWTHLGATVMIGRNDIPGEVFSLDDAKGLTRFARQHRLSRVSAWSLNRDAQCGSVFAQVAVLSNTCSGVKQATLAFTKILMRLPGTNTADAAELRPGAIPHVVAAPTDDPATSPYPIWSPGAPYPAAYKVVWHHNVYQAKWYTQDQSPDGPTAQTAQSPWLLLGPVRSTDEPMRLIRSVDASELDPWADTAAYHAGDRVQYRGLPFEARWYVKTTAPDTTLPADPDAPWKPLFRAAGEPHDPNGGA
jgi:chitinase